eukprot:TRINITY_DN3344_c0_g1_i1.p3 TRINITY_DN3344_c0_g1~~TRINITY_DN3344_c0_g1_i1.p3  ORF type:complete len:140 (+),score=21.14 TRINITY_DN3344_c0_g1_i1:155-574(+)
MFILVVVVCFVGLSISDVEVQPCNKETCLGGLPENQQKVVYNDDQESAFVECRDDSCLEENSFISTLLISPTTEAVDDLEDEYKPIKSVIPTPAIPDLTPNSPYNPYPYKTSQSSGVQVVLPRVLLIIVVVFMFYCVGV